MHKNLLMYASHFFAGMSLVFLSAGCSALMNESTSIHQEISGKGLRIVQELPKELPDKTSPIEGTHYVLVSADSGMFFLADMANPIPFVGGVLLSKWQETEANQLKQHMNKVDPYAIALKTMRESTLLSNNNNALKLMPFVYMMESEDKHYRLSLVFRVEDEKWQGRYSYHLPTTYTLTELQTQTTLMQETLRQELLVGSRQLRSMMERDANGEWDKKGLSVDYGSYFIVGANIDGLIPAHSSHFKDAELLEEGKDYVIIRSKGVSIAAGNAGALAFGIHYFYKNQLHTFVKVSGN